MKGFIVKIFICATLSLSVFSFGQTRIISFNLSVITSSSGSQTVPSVLIEFTIGKGPSCTGYTIYHSSDSINFIPIYTYAGICGDSQNNQSFTFVHSSPVFNSTNYYKIELTAIETSPVKKIFVGEAKIKGRVLPFPNPLSQGQILNLRFYNLASDRDFYGKIINEKGFTIHEFFGKSSGLMLHLGVPSIARGIYIVWLTDGIDPYSTKFIVNE